MRSILLLAALLVSSVSFARSPITSQSEILPVVEIDGQLTNYVAVLNMDYVGNKMSVKIYDDICQSFKPLQPGEKRCKAMPILEKTLEVPITDRSTNCGSNFYSGSFDKRPVDGLLTSIEVEDNQLRSCEGVLFALVVVNAETTSPRTGVTISYRMYRK